MKPILFSLLLLLSVPKISTAQQARQNLIWYGYFLSFPISENWYNVTEIQERHLIQPFQQSQFLVRTRFHKIWSKNWDTSIGISKFLHHRERPLINDDFNWPEWRPHADLTLKMKILNLSTEHRVRGEARFYQRLNPQNELDLGYFFRGYRYRYRFQVSIPIQKSLSLKLADEIMAMSGGETGGLTFDQNRFHIDISYLVSSNFHMELGYIFLHQKTGNDSFLNQDILRLNLRHQLKSNK